MTLSDNIRNARAQKKLTQKQLASLAGVSTHYIKKLESGGFKPRIALVDIAKALGVTVEELIG